MQNFNKLYPHLAPITPVVTGTQSMSLYELTGLLINRYNELIKVLEVIDPADYNAAHIAAQAAQAAAEAAAANAQNAAAAVSAFAPQVENAVTVSNGARTTAEKAAADAAEALDAARSAVLSVEEIPGIRAMARDAQAAAQGAQTAAQDAAASASGANASAAAAVAGLADKMDKTGGTFTGPVTFAESSGIVLNGCGIEDTADGYINISNANFGQISAAIAHITNANIGNNITLRNAAQGGQLQTITIRAVSGEGSGENYNGVLTFTSNGPTVDSRNKLTAIRGIAATGENDAVSLAQINTVIETANNAKTAADAATAAVGNKLDKTGGTIEGNLNINGAIITTGDITVGGQYATGKITAGTVQSTNIDALDITSGNSIVLGMPGTNTNAELTADFTNEHTVITLTSHGNYVEDGNSVVLRNIEALDQGDAVNMAQAGAI